MEYELKLHGMHCESCSKVIERTVAKHAGASVKELNEANNLIKLESTPEQLHEIQGELGKKGYQLLLPGQDAQDGFEAGSFDRGLTFVSNVITGAPELKAEHQLFQYAAGSFALILLVQALLYFAVFRGIPKFFEAYSSVLLLTGISVVTIVFGWVHSEAFRRKASCMAGMMIGMTFGMAAGFLFGAFAGATNGMFVGSLVGMATGMGIGYQTGRCCGVMGVMEGLMGGLMAGTMGAMLSVMLVFDHLIPFLYILTAIELAIMMAFSYMLYKDNGSMPPRSANLTAADFAMFSLALDLVLTVIFVYGPKAGVVFSG